MNKALIFLIPTLIFAAGCLVENLRCSQNLAELKKVSMVAKCVKCGTELQEGKCPQCTPAAK